MKQFICAHLQAYYRTDLDVEVISGSFCGANLQKDIYSNNTLWTKEAMLETRENSHRQKIFQVARLARKVKSKVKSLKIYQEDLH